MPRESFFRCNNEYGQNGRGPCEYAINNTKIPFADGIPNATGGHQCPGMTSTGQPCNCELERFEINTGLPWKKLGMGLAVLVAVCGIASAGWYFLSGDSSESADGVTSANYTTTADTSSDSQLGMRIENKVVNLDKNGQGNILIFNDGEDALEIEKVVFSNPAFVVCLPIPEESFFGTDPLLTIEVKKSAIIPVEFKGQEKERVSDTALISVDGASAPTGVRVVANHDPVYIINGLNARTKVLKHY